MDGKPTNDMEPKPSSSKRTILYFPPLPSSSNQPAAKQTVQKIQYLPPIPARSSHCKSPHPPQLPPRPNVSPNYIQPPPIPPRSNVSPNHLHPPVTPPSLPVSSISFQQTLPTPPPTPTPRPKEANDQLDRLEKNVGILSKLVCNMASEVNILLNTVGCDKPNTNNRNINVQKIYNVEELKTFNDRLGDSIYMAEIICRLLHLLSSTNSVDIRLNILLDLLFDATFLSSCSWTGRGFPNPKIPFGEYTYVLSLFKFVGGNSFIELSDEYIKNFFLNKLQHSAGRSKALGLRMTCKRKSTE